jgi:hypothetical protein
LTKVAGQLRDADLDARRRTRRAVTLTRSAVGWRSVVELSDELYRHGALAVCRNGNSLLRFGGLGVRVSVEQLLLVDFVQVMFASIVVQEVNIRAI